MKARRMTFDLALDDQRSPERGDVLATERAVYRILDARPVESRIWGNRWALTCERIGDRSDVRRLTRPMRGSGHRLWYSTLYRRGERPQDHFGAAA